MHFNKRSSQESLLTASSSPSTAAAAAASELPSSASSSSSSSPMWSYSPKTTATTNGLRLGLWCFLLMAVLLMAQQQPCECRYLPTRSHGDDLDKLRELMLQILESSNEDQRPPNEANGNTLSAQRANWLNKLQGGGVGMDGIEVSRKYGAPHGVYDNGRYY